MKLRLLPKTILMEITFELMVTMNQVTTVATKNIIFWASLKIFDS